MIYFHWITGSLLALIWISRIVDAMRGIPTMADITQSKWDRQPGPGNRVAIVVPACNEQDSIEQALRRLLALEYDDYVVIAVDDRSTDKTGEIMDRVAEQAPGRL